MMYVRRLSKPRCLFVFRVGKAYRFPLQARLPRYLSNRGYYGEILCNHDHSNLTLLVSNVFKYIPDPCHYTNFMSWFRSKRTIG